MVRGFSLPPICDPPSLCSRPRLQTFHWSLLLSDFPEKFFFMEVPRIWPAQPIIRLTFFCTFDFSAPPGRRIVYRFFCQGRSPTLFRDPKARSSPGFILTLFRSPGGGFPFPCRTSFFRPIDSVEGRLVRRIGAKRRSSRATRLPGSPCCLSACRFRDLVRC